MAIRARLKGDVDGPIDDAATLLRVSRHMQSQPLLIQYVVGLAVGGSDYDGLPDDPRLAPGPAAR